MANRYWVGGAGNWNQTSHWSDTTGGLPNFSVPGAGDVVYFDSNSGTGTVIINVAASCLNLNFQSFTGTLSGTLALNINGNLLIDGSTSLTWNYTGTISLLGALSSQTINNQAGVTINSPIIINASATTTYTFVQDITTSKAITITNGNVTAQTIQSLSFTSNTSQTVSIVSLITTGVSTFNNSTINISAALICTTLTISNSANFTANGSVNIANLITGIGSVCVFNSNVNMTSNTLNSSFGGSSLTFNNFVIIGDGRTLTQTSGNTVFNISYSYLQNCYNLTISGGTFTHNNNVGLNLINNLSISNASTLNVKIINCKAISVSTGTMNVSSTTQNSIVATSCTITNNGTINNLGGGYFTDNLSIAGYFYNKLYVEMFTSTSTITLNSGVFNTDYGIYATSEFIAAITVNNGTFTWGNPSLNILDINSATLSGTFLFVQGTVNINTNVKTGRFSSDNSNARALNLRAGITWEITSADSQANNLGYITWAWNIKTNNYIPGLNLSGTTIKFTNRTNNSSAYDNVTFGAGGSVGLPQRYGTVWFNRIDGTNVTYQVNGNNVVMGVAEFDNFIDGTPEPVTNPSLYDIVAHTIYFESIDAFTFHDFNVNGGINTRAGAYRISLRSITSTATPFYFYWVGTGIKNSYSLNIYSGVARPYNGVPLPTSQDTWFAYNSLDNNGGTPTCVGWNFIFERYWVTGGNGLWSNSSNWSFVSNGASGFSQPTYQTNAIFDANSGNNNVIITNGATCYDLNAQNFSGDFSNGGGTDYGLAINNNANFGNNSLRFQNWGGGITMLCTNKTVYLNTGNSQIINSITVQDNGSLQGTVRLSNNLNTTKNIYVYRGGFNTSDGTTNYNITCNSLYTQRLTGVYYPVEIYLNSSTINLTGFVTFNTVKYCWSMYSSPATYTKLNAGTSTIRITSSGNDNIVFDANDYASVYNTIWVDRNTSTGSTAFAVRTSDLTAAEFRDTTASAHSLLFDTGYNYNFSIFNVNGSSGNVITIDRTAGTTQVAFNKASPTSPTYLNYVNVRNNIGNPNNSWYVNSANSTLTNTTQWYFGVNPIVSGAKKMGLLGVG